MKTIRFYSPIFAAVLLSMVSACSPKSVNTTKVVGQFTENAPETVRFTRGYYDGTMEEEAFVSFFDTTVAVVDGRFEVEVPKCLTSTTDLMIGNNVINFISDGSTITIDPEARIAVSSDKKGPHTLFMDYATRWDDYQAKMAGFGDDQEARDQYRKENLGALVDYLKEIAHNNPDNLNGLNALQLLYFNGVSEPEMAQDPEEMLALINGLSDEIKTAPMSSMMYSELVDIYSPLVNTVEGKPFVDFTVVQDPENPETSTVKLSDYVGKGKYVLVDFWASWCGPCWREIPNVANAYNTYHGENFDVLSIAVMDNVESTIKAAKELGINWNQIINAQQIPQKAYGFNAIPLIILFGPDGTILKRDLRAEQIDEAVKEALGV